MGLLSRVVDIATWLRVAPGRGWRGFQTFRTSILWWALVTRQRWWVVASFVTSTALVLLSITIAQTTATLFDDAITEATRPIGPLVWRLVVLGVIEAAVFFANLMVASRIEFNIEFDMRNRLYNHLQSASPRELDSVATGQMITRALTDLDLLQILLQLLPLIVSGVPLLLGYAVYLGSINLPLTFLVISLFPFNLYFVNKVRPRLWGLAFLGLNQQAEVTTAVDEPVRGVRVVKAFGAEDRERKRVKTAASEAYRFLISRARLEAKFDVILRPAPVVVRTLLLVVGSRFVVRGDMTIGKFVIFYSFMVQGTQIAQLLDELVALWQVCKTGAGRITQLLAISPAIAAERSTPLPEGSTGLEMRHVGVGFGDTTAIADLDLAVRPRTMTVLTGGPGSGKSTAAEVAAGLIPPTEGEVLLDGVDVRSIQPEDMHKAVHLVSEEPFLFARTVRENLTVGALAGSIDPHVRLDDEVLWAAIRAAGADEVVEQLGAGLDEPLGDRGMTLSGGQRQRLALARALVAPPRVLVLDDSLSAVNPRLEVDILRSIRAHAPETAILCISRRPGPAAIADELCSLPPAGSARKLEAPGEAVPAGLPASVYAGAASAIPYDPRLLEVIGTLKIGDDKPGLPEEQATDVTTPPALRTMLWSQRRRVLQAAGALMLFTIGVLVPDLAFGEAADYVRDGNTRATDLLGLALVGSAIAIGFGQYVFRITHAMVNQGVLYGLRRRVFERLTRLGVEYYDRELPGYVAARVVHDIDNVSRFLGNGFGSEGFYQLLSNSATFLGAMGLITYLSPTVALVVLPFALGVLLVTGGQVRIADRAFARARVRLGDVVARLQEDYAGRYVISAFGAERRARLDFETAALELRRARRWAAVVTNGYLAIVSLLLTLGIAAIYRRAGGLALAGALSVGTVVSLRFYLETAFYPIRYLGRVVQDYVKARVSMRQLAQPFGIPILPIERADARPCPPLRGGVELDSVSFTYPSTARQVLHDVSLRVEPGEVIAIVGYTGAGKSSISKLVGRIYDPDAGAVRVDGTDLREFDLTSYRRRLGIVPQDAFLFRGTVATNIAYGKPDASADEIEAAARAVGGHDTLVRMHGGYGATVEEEGRNLTAAERQLIAIARMWLVRPDILLLDEATASLDPATEEAVLDAMCSLGRTVILVTHRIAAAERANRAVVVDGGRIIESGTHAELMAVDGPYSRLWTWTGQTEPAAG